MSGSRECWKMLAYASGLICYKMRRREIRLKYSLKNKKKKKKALKLISGDVPDLIT